MGQWQGTTRRLGSSACRSAVLLGLVVVLLAAAQPATAQLQVESKDGTKSIKFGLMIQGRAEWLDTADGSDTSQDLYFRRLRLLAGGKITDKLTFFFETDSPNLGKGNADGSKASSDVYIQDFVLSYKTSDAFIIDAGLVLIPLCYNCNNSAAALLPVDYGAYSFLESGPTTSNVGRDYGLQARGYLANDHLEYRAGVFQGARGLNSTNEFRYAGRIMWHAFEPQKGLFYTGTSLGTKKLFSIGASIDTQDDYQSLGFDVFWDQPLANGNGLTIQADVVQYDGGTTFTSFPKQTATLFEIAYFVKSLKLSPFFTYLSRDFDARGAADEDRWQAGLAYWISGHNLNLKLGAGRIERDGAEARTNIILQCQVFMF